ncbi:MAG: cache domain-containing protein, partial [Oscillospiraceae bacterium]
MIKKKIFSTAIIMAVCIITISIVAFFIQTNGITKLMNNAVGTLNEQTDQMVEREAGALAKDLAMYLTEIEDVIDLQMRNAALLLQKQDMLEGVSKAEMQKLAEQTGVSDMYLSDINGVFTVSTVKEAPGTCLFDIWDGYRRLVTGESTELPSAIKVMVETGKIYKFTAMPRYDKDGKIIGTVQSALNAQKIEDVIGDFLKQNTMLGSVVLFEPNGIVLTSNSREGTKSEYIKGETATNSMLKQVADKNELHITTD